jgi:hypothetical protein
MFGKIAPNPWDFERNLTAFVPLIRQLTHKTVMLWTSQHPVANADYEDVEQFVTHEKISLYNSISRRILR